MWTASRLHGEYEYLQYLTIDNQDESTTLYVPDEHLCYACIQHTPPRELEHTYDYIQLRILPVAKAYVVFSLRH